jgi:hypothetical protein
LLLDGGTTERDYMFPIWQDLQLKQYKEQFERERLEEYNKCISSYKEILESNLLTQFINKKYVYFLKKNKTANIVKIGFSWSVDKRVYDVGREMFEMKCILVGLIPGGRQEEYEIHKKFHYIRIKGSNELFFYTDSLRYFIEENMTDYERDAIKIINKYVFPKDKNDFTFIVVDGWSGIRKIKCIVIGETKRRYKVKLLESAKLPSNKIGREGDEILVPKHAVRFPGDNHVKENA